MRRSGWRGTAVKGLAGLDGVTSCMVAEAGNNTCCVVFLYTRERAALGDSDVECMPRGMWRSHTIYVAGNVPYPSATLRGYVL